MLFVWYYLSMSSENLANNHTDATNTKKKFSKQTIVVVAVILVIAVITAVIIINSLSNADGLAEDDTSSENVSREEYVGKIDNATVKEVISEISEETLNEYFDNYEYDRIDAYYNTVEADVLDYSDKSALFVDKANRLMHYSPNEIDRIAAAFRQAYIYDKDDISILRRLYRLYIEADYTEQASQVKQEILDYYYANYWCKNNTSHLLLC